MVESRRGEVGRRGEDSHGFIARGREGCAPIDFIVQTLHAGGQLQQAQSNKGLRKLILDCSTCVWMYLMILFPLKKRLEGLPGLFSQLFFKSVIPAFDYPPSVLNIYAKNMVVITWSMISSNVTNYLHWTK